MPTRRTLCLAGLALPLRAAAGPARGGGLLDRAIARAGGWAALSRARVLHWTGSAKIFAAERVIEIGLSTTVRPWRGARSDSWLASDGPAKTRSLIIEGAQGWTEIGGQRSPMPTAQLTHERAQYALYGLMLLTPLRDPKARLRTDTARREIAVDYPDAPATTLAFDADGRLASAHNVVPSPDAGGGAIHQDIVFSGELMGGGVRWPQRLSIAQDAKPYFDLTLASFDAGPA